MGKSFTNEIEERVLSIEERENVRPINTKQAETLRERARETFLEQLGIVIGENWEIPSAGYIPRMFLTYTDDEGNEKISSFEKAGIQPGSMEFWQQVQLGNVYAYPEDEKDPVQVQMDVPVAGLPEIKFSKPVKTTNLPQLRVERPSLWKRFANFITRGRAYKKECNLYKNREQNRTDMLEKLQDMQDDRPKFSGNGAEEAYAEQKRTELAEERKRIEKEGKLAGAETKAAFFRNGEDGMTSVFRPDPEFRPDKPRFLKKKGQEGLYTKEQFDSLKVYGKDEIDLDQIKVGESGKSLTPEEFAGVTMFALWDNKIAMKSIPMGGGAALDIHATSSLGQYGISEKEAETLLCTGAYSMYTGDLFIPGFRDNEGAYFKEITNLGRKSAVEAFQAYQKGDNSKLAGIIADGINKTAGVLNTVSRTSITHQDWAAITMSGKLLDLMEKDPALKAAAEAKGMDPERLKAVQASQELRRMEQEARDAVVEIAKANKEGRELTEEEKQKFGKAIMKSKIAVLRLKTDNDEVSPEIMEKMALIGNGQQVAEKKFIEEWAKHPEKRPAPKPGKVWYDTGSKAIVELGAVYGKPSKSLLQLNTEKGRQQLDIIVEEACKQVDFKGKSTAWFAEEYLASGPDKVSTVDTVKVYGDALKALVVPEKKEEQPAVGPKQPEKEQVIENENREPVVQPGLQV